VTGHVPAGRYPLGGFRTVTAGLEAALRALGVRVRAGAAVESVIVGAGGAEKVMLPPPLRTNRTRRVLHPVLIGHALSFTPYALGAIFAGTARAR
jgi:phytoene dehydrogenase-like protein